MRHPRRDDGVARGRNGSPGVYSCTPNDALEHVGEAEPRAELLELLDPARRHPDRRALRRVAAALQVHRAPHPRDEVAPVVEVEVRDHDRVDARPRVALAQPREHARARSRAGGSPIR